MKKLIFILIFLSLYSFNAQKLSDYKYVFVPQNFKDFGENKYGLNSALVKKLKDNGYEVIQSEMESWPKELNEKPCKVAILNILNTSSFFKNRLTFEARDCNDKIILEKQGVSNEKDFEVGYQEALKQSIAGVQISSPPKQMDQLILDKAEATAIVKDIPVVKKTEATPNSKNKSENYSNGKENFQKIITANGQFIFVAPNSPLPYASFREAAKKGVFHIILQNGVVTLGYLENEKYVIELPQEDGSFRKEIFQKN